MEIEKQDEVRNNRGVWGTDGERKVILSLTKLGQEKKSRAAGVSAEMISAIQWIVLLLKKDPLLD